MIKKNSNTWIQLSYDLKNYANLGRYYSLKPNTLLDLHNSSNHTQPRPIQSTTALWTPRYNRHPANMDRS